MPAARPSKAAVMNSISAVIELGFQPAELQVNADGSFRVQIMQAPGAKIIDPECFEGDNSEPMSWGDAA